MTTQIRPTKDRAHVPVTVGVLLGMLTETHTDSEIMEMLSRKKLKQLLNVVRK